MKPSMAIVIMGDLCICTKLILYLFSTTSTSYGKHHFVSLHSLSPRYYAEMFSYANNDDANPLPATATEIYLAERPESSILPSTFVTRTVPLVSELPSGYVLVRVLWLSVDPAMRGWLSTEKNYIPPVRIGATMRASGVGEVLKSNDDDISVGSTVTGLLGWCDACITSAKNLTVAPSLPPSLPDSVLLGALGITGLTAYFGLLNVGALKSTDAVLISSAAGATGSVALQIAKHVYKCPLVIGIAGGAKKCTYVVDVLGADYCLDYKSGSAEFEAQLRRAIPKGKGIDVYFDNVGGWLLETALRKLNLNGRIVICGAISLYNQKERNGPKNYLKLLTQRGTMRGFIVTDFEKQFATAARKLMGWIGQGKIVVKEDVVHGLENAPRALNRLFEGKNIGKVVVSVNPRTSTPVIMSKL